MRIKERDADTFLGDDKNCIQISCGIIWNKANPVLRLAAGASNLNKAGFTELLHDEIPFLPLPKLIAELEKEQEKQAAKKKRPVTVSLDGKTIRSTAKMAKYDSPLHTVSAYASEL